jgi:hypothetical protein
MTKTGKFEDIRRSPPEVVAEHQRWAPYAVKGATLADLRQLVGKTQEEVGRAMGISGVEAGRMEKRPDVQVSTIVRFLAALGGELEVYARFDEKLVPLRMGEFNRTAFGEFAAERLVRGEWTTSTKLADAVEAYRSANPLQPEPDDQAIQEALLDVRQLILGAAAPSAMRAYEHLRAQAARMPKS